MKVTQIRPTINSRITKNNAKECISYNYYLKETKPVDEQIDRL